VQALLQLDFISGLYSFGRPSGCAFNIILFVFGFNYEPKFEMFTVFT
jgi:hypothetical protein